MRLVRLVILFAALVIIGALPAIANEPLHMTLLAAHDDNGTLAGSTADVYLEIQPGTGRVFLETFPLTKVDTQISTRFAKEIACNYFDLKCDGTDFIYTIKSDSPIIGGPSAGAALAALTTAAILKLPINQSVAVTGTINSGGLVGPVGGLRAKADAARQAKIETVLIPIGTLSADGENSSIEAIEYGKNYSINVVEVGDLGEVVFYFTGKKLVDGDAQVVADSLYTDIMKSISTELCERSDDISRQLESYSLNESDSKDITNRTAKAEEASSSGAHYSAASYCFGLNIKLRGLLYDKQKLSEAKIKSKAAQLKLDMERFENETRARELHTITDLQAFTIVIERLAEAQRYISQIDDQDQEQQPSFLLAYAEERFFSAKVWSRFFDMGGASYILNEDILKNSCIEKIQEAQERIQYLSVFLPQGVDSIEDNLGDAQTQEKEGEYALCLIQASEAKAEANAILGTIGVDEDEIGRLLDSKFAALQRLIARMAEKRAFPILGYSYYEYANSLRGYEQASALLYSEYALEMSNLDIYFKEDTAAKTGVVERLRGMRKELLWGFAGLAAGVAIMLLVRAKPLKRHRKRR